MTMIIIVQKLKNIKQCKYISLLTFWMRSWPKPDNAQLQMGMKCFSPVNLEKRNLNNIVVHLKKQTNKQTNKQTKIKTKNKQKQETKNKTNKNKTKQKQNM